MIRIQKQHIYFIGKSLAWAILLFLSAMTLIYWDDFRPASTGGVVIITGYHDSLSVLAKTIYHITTLHNCKFGSVFTWHGY